MVKVAIPVILKFLNHCFPTIPKTKVDIHVFSAVEIFFDMLSLETLLQLLYQMSQTSRKKFGVNPFSGYDFV